MMRMSERKDFGGWIETSEMKVLSVGWRTAKKKFF